MVFGGCYMNKWKGLLRKEFHISKAGMLVSIALVIFGHLIAYTFSLIYNEPKIMILPSIAIIVLHVFYLTVFMYLSLQMEAKQLHLWLHTPYSASSLLLAKLLTGMAGFLFSFSVSGIFAYIGLLKLRVVYVSEELLEPTIVLLRGLMVGINVFLFSIYLAIWLVFYWTIYQLLKRLMTKLIVPVIVIIGFFLTWMGKLFQKTVLYEKLTKWGYVDIDVFGDLDKHYEMMEIMAQFPIGTIVFYSVITIGLFILSAWLIDRKVEV
jgi:hypothetical protein